MDPNIGLPMNCKTIQMGMKLGGTMGEVLEACIYDFPERNTVVKVRILMDIKSPIMHGMYISIKMNEVYWVDFRYGRLPMFCFYCGLMGHGEELWSKITSPSHGISEVNPLGPRMKATYNGRKNYFQMKGSLVVTLWINLT